MANPDLLRIIQTVGIQSTPVLISQNLTWVRQQDLAHERAGFDATLDKWARAKSTGEVRGLLSHYAPDFAADGKLLSHYQTLLRQEVVRLAGRGLRLSEVSVLGWSDDAQVRVVTFAQTVIGVRSHRVMRQYWERRGAVVADRLRNCTQVARTFAINVYFFPV